MNIGIIGGLGPLATAYLMELVTNMTVAECDQDHIPMLIYNNPQIPDRTAYILDRTKENPAPYMIRAAKEMQKLGIDTIGIPCITAHYFYDEIKNGIGDIRLIHMVSSTAKYLAGHGIKSAGIVATDGTIQSAFFQKKLEQEGISVVVPKPDSQKIIMDIIYNDIKSGKKPNMQGFRSVSKELYENGAEIIILGCTEFSLIKRDYNLTEGYIDVMDVLAREIVLAAGKTIRPEYEIIRS